MTDKNAFEVGQDVTWRHVPRGGWGFPVFIPAKVVKVNPKTIRIEAQRTDGQSDQRNVKPESLRPRQVLTHQSDRYDYAEDAKKKKTR